MAEALQHIVERTQTVTLACDTTDSAEGQDVAAIRLKLTKAKKDKKVSWRDGTVDNEHLNKKKSKCCCVYQKPRSSLESSSEDEGTDCEDCRGHVEKKKKPLDPDPDPNSNPIMEVS